MKVRSLLLVLALPLGACGGTTTNPPPVQTLGDFTTAYIGVMCDALFRCDVDSDSLGIRLMLGSATNCRTRLGPLLQLQIGRMQESITAGRTRYNATAAQQCLASVADRCDLFESEGFLAASCNQVFQGTVPAGGTCYRHDDCAGDTWCDRTNPAGPSNCPGTCRARVALGAMCNTDAQCTRMVSAGAVSECLGSGGTPSCVEVRPGTPAAAGQACGDSQAMGHVVTRTACATGLACPSEEPAMPGMPPPVRLCRVLPAAGAACTDPGSACAGSTICYRPPGSATALCTAISIRNHAGETCGMPPVGALCNPFEHLTCQAGACVAQGNGLLGSACESGDLSMFTCNVGLYCQSSTHTCQTLKPAGQPCEGSSECLSGTCAGSPRTCAAMSCG